MHKIFLVSNLQNVVIEFKKILFQFQLEQSSCKTRSTLRRGYHPNSKMILPVTGALPNANRGKIDKRCTKRVVTMLMKASGAIEPRSKINCDDAGLFGPFSFHNISLINVTIFQSCVVITLCNESIGICQKRPFLSLLFYFLSRATKRRNIFIH